MFVGETVVTLVQGTLAIVDNHAWLMEGTEDGITLAIKPNGITCTLSKFLPQYIAKNIAFFADGFLKKHNLGRDDGELPLKGLQRLHSAHDIFCVVVRASWTVQ